MTKTIKLLIIVILKIIGKILTFLKPQKKCLPTNAKKILIISLHYIGDVLFTTPAIKAIREKYHDAYISVWVKTRAKDILFNNPQINEILIFDDINTAGKREKDKNFNLKGKIKFAKLLRHKKFDLVFDFTGLFVTALYSLISGAKYRFGINQQGVGFLLTKEFPRIKARHLKETSLNILRQLKIPINSEKLELFINEKDIKFGDKFLANIDLSNPIFGIHPFAAWDSKCWGIDKFAELCNKLNTIYNTNIIIFGASDDVKKLPVLLKLIIKKPMIACGKTTLAQTSALIKKCNIFIGNDTGLSYIAEALNIPVVIIFGSTNSVYSEPISKHIIIKKILDCSPRSPQLYCHNKVDYKCLHHKCMELITVEEVLDVIKKLL